MSVTLNTTPILAKPRSIDLSTPFLISPPFTPYEPLPPKKGGFLSVIYSCDVHLHYPPHARAPSVKALRGTKRGGVAGGTFVYYHSLTIPPYELECAIESCSFEFSISLTEIQKLLVFFPPFISATCQPSFLPYVLSLPHISPVDHRDTGNVRPHT